MRILLATFANRHSSNMGVGRHYNKIADILEKQGHELIFFHHPNPFKVERTTLKHTIIPMFAGCFSNAFGKIFEELKPDAVHIQSEVGIGLAARHYCNQHQIPYSSAYHTNWDIGMKHWAHLPAALVWQYLRWYYKPASVIHASTYLAKNLLQEKGINNRIEIFPLGVDLGEFYYDPDPSLFTGLPRPFFMTMSRVAKEKNIESFLKLDLPGTKFVIGDGPQKKFLANKYANKAVFLPYQNIRKILSMGDVFVFPSRFDTFGLTNLEALACGLPIAAYPVMGPVEIIEPGITGYVSDNLTEAALACLSLKKADCISSVSRFSWVNTAEEFLKHQILLN